MAITRPVTRTIISTSQWGIPITDQVNEHEAEITALQATVPWINMTLQNGYYNQAGGFWPCSYRKINGDCVQLRGVMAGPANTDPTGGLVFTNLPAGYRSPNQAFLGPGNWTGTTWVMCRLGVNTNGNLQIGFTTGQYIDITCQYYI